MKAHAIMVALPYQGHLSPLIDLAMKLASKGITVTFINTQHAHNQMATSQHASSDHELDIFSEARASGLDISYSTISDGFPLEFDRDLNVLEFWEFQIRHFPSLVAEFVGDIIASSSSTPFLVADTFSMWHRVVADKYNLVNVSFWTEPAIVFAIDYHLHLLTQNGHYPPKGMFVMFLCLTFVVCLEKVNIVVHNFARCGAGCSDMCIWTTYFRALIYLTFFLQKIYIIFN